MSHIPSKDSTSAADLLFAAINTFNNHLNADGACINTMRKLFNLELCLSNFHKAIKGDELLLHLQRMQNLLYTARTCFKNYKAADPKFQKLPIIAENERLISQVEVIREATGTGKPTKDIPKGGKKVKIIKSKETVEDSDLELIIDLQNSPEAMDVDETMPASPASEEVPKNNRALLPKSVEKGQTHLIPFVKVSGMDTKASAYKKAMNTVGKAHVNKKSKKVLEINIFQTAMQASLEATQAMEQYDSLLAQIEDILHLYISLLHER
ncbi:hypothetical protein BDQ17DRAFT_1432076 [Cyathus striatus]|nr:hypothetical protein BDQ17DRAFT_1432076 [Cyathus striatus]